MATAVVIMSRFLHSPGAVPPVEQASIAADLSRRPMSHKKAIVRTEVEQFDGVTSLVHERDELLKCGGQVKPRRRA